MSVPVTWIEIVDTSVKIGLGALISGVSAYLINRQSHEKNIEKEYFSKRTLILEGVTIEIEEMTHVMLKYWSFILDWSRNKEKGQSNTQEKSDTIKLLRAELFSHFKGITVSEGKLLLIGCKEQQESLRSYGEFISEFYRYASRNNDEMESAKLESWRETLLVARQSLYSQLNFAYKNAKI
jgi:hypothetical protein